MIRRSLFATLLAVGCFSLAQAHFVFVIPDAKTPSNVVVVFSEELEPDENVPVAKMAALKLKSRDAAGKDTALEHKTGKHELTATVPGSGPRVVYGTLNYGVMQKGDAKPYLLAYHPKAILGEVAPDKSVVGKAIPVEVVAISTGADVKFQFLSAGKPVADAEVNVMKPDGSKAKTKTNKDGMTETFPAKGRYGVWTKDTAATPGELDGKKYDEVRNYATLVVEFPAK